ncbi:hypothetical protein ANN_09739 [Periplaneta americana]|uniref:Uncharacterized protein n=1 Tax=Periplaneta americana TaxID=6978 RepID=A0ABQ8TM46_PERAM|nr:hypothetical protein ANN_09739 [Periplaneta americana]
MAGLCEGGSEPSGSLKAIWKKVKLSYEDRTTRRDKTDQSAPGLTSTFRSRDGRSFNQNRGIVWLAR